MENRENRADVCEGRHLPVQPAAKEKKVPRENFPHTAVNQPGTGPQWPQQLAGIVPDSDSRLPVYRVPVEKFASFDTIRFDFECVVFSVVLCLVDYSSIAIRRWQWPLRDDVCAVSFNY